MFTSLLEPGSILERYEIVRLVGRGGMGEVYHAIDTRLRRPVALKVLRHDKDQSAETGTGGVARLLREARAAAALNHPNSVAIYELGEADGVAYIAMELVLGESFRRHSQKASSVSVETKLSWLVDAARALWAAHKSGIVHRDIKPSNIMVSEEGIVKVLDFGLAKPEAHSDAFRTNDAGAFQTVLGQVLGTPKYMSPEQLEGKRANPRTDQYAFGLTAYELLCGEYAGGPLAGSIRSLDEVAPAVPRDLARIITRCMMRSADDRYETMERVAHELRLCVPIVQSHHNNMARQSDPATFGKFADTLESLPPSAAAATLRMSPSMGAAVASAVAAATARPPTPATLPLARPFQISLPPQQHHQHQQTALSPRPVPVPMMVIATPPSVVSGVFPTGSMAPPASGATPSMEVSIHSGAAPPIMSSAQLQRPPATRNTGWIVVIVIVGLIALSLGAVLALTLR